MGTAGVSNSVLHSKTNEGPKFQDLNLVPSMNVQQLTSTVMPALRTQYPFLATECTSAHTHLEIKVAFEDVNQLEGSEAEHGGTHL